MTMFLERAYIYHLSSSIFWRFLVRSHLANCHFGHFIFSPMSYGHFITYSSHLLLSVIAAQHSALPTKGRDCGLERWNTGEDIVIPPQKRKKQFNKNSKSSNNLLSTSYKVLLLLLLLLLLLRTPYSIQNSPVNSAIQTGRIAHVTSSISGPVRAEPPVPSQMEVQLASTPWSSPPDKLDRSEPRVDSVRSSRLGRHKAPLQVDSQLKGFTSSFFRCPNTPPSGLRKGG